MSTGASSMTVPRTDAAASSVAGARSRVADYVELTKPRITILEVITVLAALYLATNGMASDSVFSLGLLAATVIGTTLVAASANTINQYLERQSDGRMLRTASRPLPAGRLTPSEAALFGIACLAVGSTILAIGANWQTAAIGVGSWLLYVGVYTPMKPRTTWNTFVGAISGALPILMGWTAGGGEWNLTAAGLFGVLFFWQFPHFMAIAWLCKDDYRRGGYKMSTVVEPTGLTAGAHAVASGAMLLPVCLLPVLESGGAAPVYSTIAVLLGVAQLYVAFRFFIKRNDLTARHLLRASLLYLPAWLLTLCLCAP